MNILTVDEITKAYGERKIFDQASFLKKVADYPDASKSSCPSPEKFMDYFEKADAVKNRRVEWIVPNAQKNAMEPVRLTLHSGGTSEIHLPHEGEEFGYVLKGTIRITYGGKTQIVRAGEAFYIKAGKKHFLENTGARDAVLIWVTTPPSF